MSAITNTRFVRRSSAPEIGVVIVFYTNTVLHTAITSAGFDPNHIAKSACEVGVGCMRLVVGVCLKNVKGVLGACEHSKKMIRSLCRHNLQVLGRFSRNNFVVCVAEKGFSKASIFEPTTRHMAAGSQMLILSTAIWASRLLRSACMPRKLVPSNC